MTHTHNLNNFRLRHDGKEYVVYAKVHYTVEKDDGGDEAVFESAVVEEAIGQSGIIRERTFLDSLEMPLLSVLNNDVHIARSVALRSKKS